MSTPPRRRRPDARNPKSDGGGWLPTIAMGLGVVVAGLGIGALVAVLMQRPPVKPPVAAVAIVTSTPAPAPAPARAPVAIATIEPPRSPEPSPAQSPSAAPAPTDEPTVQASPSPSHSSPPPPSAKAVHEARSLPTRVAVESERAVTAAPVATPTQALTEPSRMPAVTPAPAATAVPTATSSATAAALAPASTPAVESGYDDRAAAVVRRYLDALIRGDEKAAYAALGGSGGTLSEQAFIDPGTRVVSVKVTRIDASNASVGCEIASAKGHYYATYHVTAASSGPYISQHDYIKV